MCLVIAATSVPVWAKLGYVVGTVGVCFAAIRWWNERRERKRIRPVVIVHERLRRHLSNERWIADVYLTNESSASAFNIRFGIQIGDAEVAWKHDQADQDASRLNVLRPGARYPEVPNNAVELAIPDEIVFSIKGDPEAGRRYWARYESPAGERWYTSNPVQRSEDLVVKRVRSRRWS